MTTRPPESLPDTDTGLTVAATGRSTPVSPITTPPVLRWTERVWDIEPTDVARRYSRGHVRITRVKRQVHDDGEVRLVFYGYPLTSKGNINGALEVRPLHDVDAERLTATLPAVTADDAGAP